MFLSTRSSVGAWFSPWCWNDSNHRWSTKIEDHHRRLDLPKINSVSNADLCGSLWCYGINQQDAPPCCFFCKRLWVDGHLIHQVWLTSWNQIWLIWIISPLMSVSAIGFESIFNMDSSRPEHYHEDEMAISILSPSAQSPSSHWRRLETIAQARIKS